MSSCDVGKLRRTATITAMGSSAATVPFSPISAVRPALSNMVNTRRRRELPPDFSTSIRPSHVVTPVASRPSLTTKRAAIRITAGSPKPASDSSKVSTPLKKSASAAPTATSSTGKRFHTNSTTTAARIDRLTVASLMKLLRRSSNAADFLPPFC